MRADVRRLHDICWPTAEAELILQTYIMNGIEPDILSSAAENAEKDRREKMRAVRERDAHLRQIHHAGGVGGGL